MVTEWTAHLAAVRNPTGCRLRTSSWRPRMNDRNELMRSVMAFDIDQGPASLTFAQRLARENLWTRDYATRVIHEYKRFVLLAMLAGQEVTPSEQVDQAWHLHLTYTKAYWEGLRPLLPRPLHHNPTRGGSAEDVRFEDQYLQTLDHYRRLFGEEPPSDIWPSAERRFGHDSSWARVNTKDCWVIPREPARKALLRASVWCGAVIFMGSGAVWASTSAGGGGFSPAVVAGLFLAGVLVLAALILSLVGRQSRSDKGGSSSGCSSIHGSHGCSSSHRDSSDSGGGSSDGDSGGGGSSGCGSGCGGGGCGGGGD
jgi:hypothetical protein